MPARNDQCVWRVDDVAYIRITTEHDPVRLPSRRYLFLACERPAAMPDDKHPFTPFTRL